MADEWFFRVSFAELGPFSTEEMRTFFQNGRIKSDTLVRRGDAGAWAKASEVDGLLSLTITPSASKAIGEQAVARQTNGRCERRSAASTSAAQRWAAACPTSGVSFVRTRAGRRQAAGARIVSAAAVAIHCRGSSGPAGKRKLEKANGAARRKLVERRAIGRRFGQVRRAERSKEKEGAQCGRSVGGHRTDAATARTGASAAAGSETGR
jgi:hypothetical protein